MSSVGMLTWLDELKYALPSNDWTFDDDNEVYYLYDSMGQGYSIVTPDYTTFTVTIGERQDVMTDGHKMSTVWKESVVAGPFDTREAAWAAFVVLAG